MRDSIFLMIISLINFSGKRVQNNNNLNHRGGNSWYERSDEAESRWKEGEEEEEIKV